MKRLVLLDSHAILHRAYHALPDFATAKSEPTGALYGLSSMLIKIIEDLKPDYIVACYDLKGPTHRHEVFKEYKAQRKELDDDLAIQINKSHETFEALNIPIYSKAGFEADDILGTIVKQLDKSKDLEIIIASGDMDTLQLVNGKKVKAYTLKKGIRDTIMYDEDAVMSRFGFGPERIPDYKGLSGDPSDNIPGVKGIGEKTATTLITSFGAIENIYKELEAGHEDKFEKAGVKPRIVQLLKDNKEEAEFSKMLATIRRDAPIEFNLPEKSFKDGLDFNKANSYWTSLEFRTLGQRLKQVIEGKVPVQKAQAINRPLESQENEKLAKKPASPRASKASAGSESSSAAPSGNSLFDSNIPQDELEKTSVALWLVNSNINDPKIEDIKNFGGSQDFEEAKKKIFKQVDELGVRKVYEEIELPLIPVLHKMEKRGIKIDRAVLARLAKDYHAKTAGLEKKIFELAGMEFNVNSPKQLGDVLFDKLKLTGKI